jgi:hypothetical protein
LSPSIQPPVRKWRYVPLSDILQSLTDQARNGLFHSLLRVAASQYASTIQTATLALDDASGLDFEPPLATAVYLRLYSSSTFRRASVYRLSTAQQHRKSGRPLSLCRSDVRRCGSWRLLLLYRWSSSSNSAVTGVNVPNNPST